MRIPRRTIWDTFGNIFVVWLHSLLILIWHVLNELMRHEEGRKRIKALAGLFAVSTFYGELL